MNSKNLFRFIVLLHLTHVTHAARFTGEGAIQEKPLSPEEALTRFRLEPGMRIELVAAEPLIVDPVDIAFDERGGLFVVETIGYNRPDDAQPRSRIRRLEDRDGDGRMDHGTTFAENLDYAQGITIVRGGLLVTTNSAIMFLRDADGDGKAEHQEIVLQGAKTDNVDAQMASPRRGLDNWVYINGGLRAKEVFPPSAPERKLEFGNYNFRYHPVTRAYEPAAGRGQFGNTFDSWGREFFSSNRNPAMFAVIPHRYLVRRSEAFLTEGHEDAAPPGGEGKVYPLKTFRTTASAHAGTYTAACGIGAYRGDWLGSDYVDNLFVCEPTGSLVSRYVVESAGASLRARRPRTGQEFMASDDEWFRPVNITNGPDGALYVVDMYRRFIDGDRFFPTDYRAANDMGAGSDRGRIYRVVAEKRAAPRRAGAVGRSPAEWVALLEHANGWHRDTAQRLIVEAGESSVAPAVEKLLHQSKSAFGRCHALWTLEGLSALTAAHVLTAMGDPEPGVVENALWLAPRFIRTDTKIRDRVSAIARTSTARVKFAALLAVGELEDAATGALLAEVAATEADDRWFRMAVLSAPAMRSGREVATILDLPAFRNNSTRGRIDLANRLAMALAARGEAAELAPLFAAIRDDNRVEGTWWKMALMSGLADGLRRNSNGKLPKTLTELLAKPPAVLAGSVEGVRTLVESAEQLLRDTSRPVAGRVAAIAMLEHLSSEQVAALSEDLLTQRQPLEVQKATLEVLGNMRREVAAPILYDRLADMSGTARVIAIQYLQRVPIELVLKVKEGVVNPALIDASTRYMIMNSGSERLRKLGQEVFGKTETDRQRLVKSYTAGIVGKQGSALKGAELFRQACAVCHKFRGEGASVGPDISDVRIKTPEMLLADILDPNGTVEPRWETYSAKAKDGRVFVGIIEAETNDAIVMKSVAGQETLPRAQLESCEPMGLSLMPAGLEGALDHQQMADLIAYLRSGVEQR